MLARYRSMHYLLFAIGALLIAAAVGWFLARYTLNRTAVDPVATGRNIPAAVKAAVHLYFGDPQGRYLRAEQRVLDQPEDDVAFGRQLVNELIQGPKNSGERTLPEEARLRAFFLKAGTAYVDFVSEAFLKHPGGVGMELLTIYSIVNTLVVNVESIRDVKILIGGQERLTLAGHIELQHHFVADMMWIR